LVIQIITIIITATNRLYSFFLSFSFSFLLFLSLYNVNNEEEEELRNRIIKIYGYNGYLKILRYIVEIAELTKIINTNAYSPHFLATFKQKAYVSSLLPKGSEGYVLEDIDLIVVRWNPSDRLGTFKLFEFKSDNYYKLDKAQYLAHGLIDRMLRTTQESDRYRYEGYYLVRPYNDGFLVNGWLLTKDELQTFLLGKLKVEPYIFEIGRYL
jgi:hypothetical protein